MRVEYPGYGRRPTAGSRARKAKKLQRTWQSLRIEKLEDRSLLSVTPDTLALSWVPALAGQSFTMNAAISGALVANTPRTGTLTLSEAGNTLASVNISTAQPNSAGYFALSVPAGLPVGSDVLQVAYSGDTNYASSATSVTLNVVNDSLTLQYSTSALAGQPFTVNAAINGALVGGAARTGTLSLVEGTTTLASVDITQVSPSASGYYPVTVPGGLSVGTHNLKFVYSGDANYSAFTGTMATVTSATDFITPSFTNPALVGQAYPVNVSFSGSLINATARTGTLSLVEGTTTLTSIDISQVSPNASGAYTLTWTAGPAVGTNSLKVVYSGDSLYSSATSSFVVSGVASLSTSTSLQYSTAATVGQPYTVSAAINGTLEPGVPRTGTLSLVEAGNTLASVNVATATPNSSGYFALTVPAGLAAGTHTLKVVYSGDANYTGSTANLSRVTSAVHLQTDSLGLSWNPPLAGQSFTLNTTINGTLLANTPRTGTLTLSEGGNTLTSLNLATATTNSAGQYALTVPSGFSLGSHSLVVAYSGDTNYASATSTLTLNIVNDSLAVQYSVDAYLGQTYTVNAAINGTLVNGTPRTGTLSLVNGTATLASVDITQVSPNSSGYYALSIPGGLAAGMYNLKVVYSGDANYTALTTGLATITSANDFLGLSYTSSVLIGQPYNVGVSILTGSTPSNPTPTGTLWLMSGTTTLASLDLSTATPGSNGLYILSVSTGPTAGANSLKVIYSGDSTYSSTTSSLTITGVTTLSTSLGVSYTSLEQAGQAFTLNALINGTVAAGVPRTGTLTLSEAGNVLATVNVATTTPSSSGYYALTVPGGLPLGSNSLVVYYSGDANYGSSTTTVNANLTDDTLALSYSPSLLTGQTYTVNAAINGALVGGTPRTGTLSLMEGTTTLASVNVATTTPSSSGFYALAVPGGLPAGTYSNLSVVYTGDTHYSALTSNLGTVTSANDFLGLSYNSLALIGQPYTVNVSIQTVPGSTPAPSGTLSLVSGSTTLTSLNITGVSPGNNGFYTLTVPAGPVAGANSLKVVYSGDSMYQSSTSSLTITGVATLSTSVALSYSTSATVGQAYTVSALVNGTLEAGVPRTGTLSLVEAGNTLASVNLSTTSVGSNGYYALTVPGGLAAGTHSLSVVYSGDTNYVGSMANLNTVTSAVHLQSDSLGLSWSTPLAGQSFTVNTTINGTLLTGTPRTGTLTLSEAGNTLASVNIATATPNSAGQFALTVPAGFALGSHTLVVTYSGDANYASATSSLTLSILNDSLGLQYNIDAYLGQTYTVSAAINGALVNSTPRTGTLSLLEGTTTLASIDITQVSPNSSGYYALSVPGGLVAGAHTLKVVYSGDATYTALSAGLSTVTSSNAFLGVSYSSSVLIGQPYSIGLSILTGTTPSNPAPTGMLTVMSGTTTLTSLNITGVSPGSNGYYTLTVPGGPTAGANNLKFLYSGDSTYSSATLGLTITGVTSISTTVALSYSTSATVGQPYTVSALVNGSLEAGVPRTGTLSLVEAGNTLASVNLATTSVGSNGYYALTVPGGLAAGTHSLSVIYSGDTNYIGSSAVLSTVTSAAHLQSDSLGLSWSTPLAGQSFTLNTSINGTLLTGIARTGTLTLSDGGNTLASVNIATTTPNSAGQYALTVPAGFALGTQTLTVTYSGDTNYASATSSLTLSILNDSMALQYNIDAYLGQTYTVSAAINGALVNSTPRTGTLSLVEGTTTLVSVDITKVSPNSSGYYALSVPGGLVAGAHTLKVVYSGDATYTALSSGLSTVTSSNAFLGVSYSSSVLIGQPYSIGLSILTGTTPSNPAPTGMLTVMSGTTTLASLNITGVSPGSNGYYTLTVPGGPTAGANYLKFLYSGDSTYSSATLGLTITGVTSISTTVALSYSTSATVGQAYTVSALVNGSLEAGVPRTGTLSLVEAGNTLASVNLATTSVGSNGYYALTVPGGLAAGTHSLSVVYSGDTNYIGSSAILSTVTSAAHLQSDSLGLSWSTPLAGQSFTVNTTINGTLLTGTPRTGTLTLSEAGNTLASVNIATTTPNSAGQYALTVPAGFALGTQTLTVTYSGDSNYALATSTLTLSILNDSLGLQYNIDAYLGQTYTVSAAINGALVNSTPRTGTLSLVEGTTTLVSVDITKVSPNSSGYYALSVPGGLVAGAHTLKVVYSGDATYTALTAGLSTVTSSNAFLGVSYSSSVLIGQPYSIGLSILTGTTPSNPLPTGTLTVMSGTTTLTSLNITGVSPGSNGYYTLTVPGGPTAGANYLKFLYSGDSTYSSATLGLTITGVTSISTTVALSYSTSATVGQAYTVSALVNGSLEAGIPRTGTLSLVEAGNTLVSVNLATTSVGSNGYYALTVPGGLAAGTHSLSVIYSGDTNYIGSSANLSTVTSAVHLQSDSLGFSWATPAAGQSFTLNTSINGTLLTGIPRTGTLTLSEAGNTLASVNIATATTNSAGQYALTVPAGLAAGTNVLSVTYSGDSNYASVTGSVSVAAFNDSLVLQYATTAATGQAFSVSVAISSLSGSTATPIGTLSLMLGNTTLATLNLSTSTTNANGYYTLLVPAGLVAGTNSLRVVYSGDANYTPLTYYLAPITATVSPEDSPNDLALLSMTD